MTSRTFPAAGQLALLALCGLMTACVRVEAPPRLSFDLPEDYSATSGAEPAEQTLDLTTWWRGLGDPQLEILVGQALEGAPDLAVAQARIAEARASASRALRRFDPSGNLRGGGTRNEVTRRSGNVFVPNLPVDVPFVQIGRTDTYDTSFSAAWEVDLFGRKRATGVVAKASVDKAAYEAAGVRSALAAAVADALFRVRGVAIDRDLVQHRLAVERDALRAIDEKITSGMAAGIDRTAAEVRLNGLDAQFEQLDGELAAGKRELLVLIGRATDPLGRLEITPQLPPPPRVPSAAPGTLLERRPDVLASKADLIAALGDQALAKLDLFPTFTLLPGIGLNGTDRTARGFSTSFWSLGLQGMLPILDRGRLLAQKRANDARAQQAAASYEKSVQTAFGEADAVLSRLVAETRMTDTLARSETVAAATVTALEGAQGSGLIDPQTLRDARRQLFETRGEAARARVQQWRRTVQAYKALGGGWGGSAPAAQSRQDARARAGSLPNG